MAAIWRTPTPYARLEDVAPAFAALIELPGRQGVQKFVMDLRDVAGRNDPRFEQAVSGPRAALYAAYELAVVLVSSPIGALQLQRHAREDGVHNVLVVASVPAAAGAVQMAPRALQSAFDAIRTPLGNAADSR